MAYAPRHGNRPGPSNGNSTRFNLFTAPTAAGEAGNAPCESSGTAHRGERSPRPMSAGPARTTASFGDARHATDEVEDRELEQLVERMPVG